MFTLLWTCFWTMLLNLLKLSHKQDACIKKLCMCMDEIWNCSWRFSSWLDNSALYSIFSWKVGIQEKNFLKNLKSKNYEVSKNADVTKVLTLRYHCSKRQLSDQLMWHDARDDKLWRVEQQHSSFLVGIWIIFQYFKNKPIF